MRNAAVEKCLNVASIGIVAAYVAVTVWNQYPHPSFNRMRASDPFSMIPNWRFFAPDPASHDYHLFHRLVAANGQATTWELLEFIAKRHPLQTVWFPGRRDEKAAFDLASDLLPLVTGPSPDVALQAPAFLVMSERTRVRLVPKYGSAFSGFQLALVKDGGFDQEIEPEVLFASPFVPLTK